MFKMRQRNGAIASMNYRECLICKNNLGGMCFVWREDQVIGERCSQFETNTDNTIYRKGEN